MKVKAKELSDTERIKTLDTLYTAAGTVHGREGMKLFLRDLLTESERIMMGRRLIIARKLINGDTYNSIALGLKVGHDTIGRVQRWLDDTFPGFEKAVAEMEKEFAKRDKKHTEKKLYATSALFRLKKKYPLYYLLLPNPKEDAK